MWLLPEQETNRNLQIGTKAKTGWRWDPKNKSIVIVGWFCILAYPMFRLRSCVGVLSRRLLRLFEGNTGKPKNMSCSEVAASSPCSHFITTFSKMPENCDLVTVVVASKPLKKNNSRQGELIAWEELKLSQLINLDILIKPPKLTRLAISSIPVQSIYPKPQGLKDGVSTLIGSVFFITPCSS